MRKTVLKSERVVDIGTRPMSRAVKKGNLIFVTGTMGVNSKGILVKGGIKAQARQLFENIKAILEAGGATLDDVVNLTIYFSDVAKHYREFNEVRAEYFPKDPPASISMQVHLMKMETMPYYKAEEAGDEALVEIAAIAALG